MSADLIAYVGKVHVPFGEDIPRHCLRPVQIRDDLWVGPLEGLRRPVRTACEPPGENWHVHWMHPTPYAFWRINPPASTVPSWDRDRVLQESLILARLIRPTSIGYGYACRVRYDEGSRTIEPASILGDGARAYLVDANDDGLRDEHIQPLRRLLGVFDRVALPNRVKNALWMHERLAFTYLMNLRWPLLVTAVEALVHTDDRKLKGRTLRGSSDQFCRRLREVQQLLGKRFASDAELESIYELRSSYTHGRGGKINSLKGAPRRLYCTLENGLRAILLRAIEDERFAQVFASNTSVRDRLGV